LEILEAARGSDKEKKLATQFIGKFFKFFPSLSETAIDRQLDLCEEDDVLVSSINIYNRLVRKYNILTLFR
jgi:hypothetical protein